MSFKGHICLHEAAIHGSGKKREKEGREEKRKKNGEGKREREGRKEMLEVTAHLNTA